MSRMPRIQIEDAMYYIMPTRDHGEPIFRDDEDYELYLELLTRYKNKYNFKLFAFSLTPNSINLLIEPSGNATISQIMHVLNPSYTKYFNKKYKRTGHLFQERYRIVLIEKAPNLLKMTAYIHLRPKLLHLTDDISGYKYTSFLVYLAEERGKPGTKSLNGAQGDKLNMAHEVGHVLGYLKDKSYRQFVNEMGAGEVEELNRALEKDKVIGSADFRKEVDSRIKGERQTPPAAGRPMPIQITKADSRPVSNIWIFAVAACLAILSFIFSIFFAHTNILQIKERMKQEIAEKDIESQKMLAKELDTASKDLSKTYEAKLASYQAVIERLEAQKRKAEDELSKARVSLRLRSGSLRRKRNGLQGN